MSSTSSRIRLGRLAAGLTVAAAATASALLGATPAYAATTVTAAMDGSRVLIIGTDFSDSITASGSGSTVNLSNLLGSISAGNGCTQLGATVRCTGATSVKFVGMPGNDTFQNNTALPSSLFGGLGSDRLTGGPAADRISGGSDADFAFGQGGLDSCTAENESGCEV